MPYNTDIFDLRHYNKKGPTIRMVRPRGVKD